jgi:hypothetical protein
VQTSDALPRALEVGPFETVAMTADTTRVVTYLRYDPLDLPTELVAVLGAFDGRSVEQARAVLAEGGIEIDDALLRKLTDFGILRAPG